MFRITDTARLLNSRRAGVALAACLATTVLVAGCGGGDRVKPFQPSQIIAFGDENSAFDDTATAALMTDRLVQFKNDPSTPNVIRPYAARYTINVVADTLVEYCKNASPDPDALPDPNPNVTCTSSNAPSSVPLLTADYPSVSSFVLPQSSVSGRVRLDSSKNIIPIVKEVTTGTFNDLTTGLAIAGVPSPVYVSYDHLYYCSMDFGNDYGNWVQRLAHGLGGGALSLGGATGCAQDLGGSRSYAKWGAKVADVGTQFNDHRAELRDGVLVTLLAGQNDIMAAYAEVKAGTLSAENAQIRMREQGAILGGIIKNIVATGARVVYLTVPDMGRSPRAVLDGKIGLANDLTKAFNEGYLNVGGLTYSTGTNGHKIVKVDGYSLISSLGATYSDYACQTDPSKVTMPNGSTLLSAFPSINAVGQESLKAKALLLNCRSNNLRVVLGDFTASPPTEEIRGYYLNYLWADDQRLAPMGHGNLANLAIARIRDQL